MTGGSNGTRKTRKNGTQITCEGNSCQKKKRLGGGSLQVSKGAQCCFVWGKGLRETEMGTQVEHNDPLATLSGGGKR